MCSTIPLKRLFWGSHSQPELHALNPIAAVHKSVHYVCWGRLCSSILKSQEGRQTDAHLMSVSPDTLLCTN